MQADKIVKVTAVGSLLALLMLPTGFAVDSKANAAIDPDVNSLIEGQIDFEAAECAGIVDRGCTHTHGVGDTWFCGLIYTRVTGIVNHVLDGCTHL